MIEPVAPEPGGPLTPPRPASPGRPAERVAGGADFAGLLRRQLEEVGRMQAEADAGVEHLLTGQTDNITGVFVAARKAEVAFSLLMEIRNKLLDAYQELRQLRV